MIFLLRCNSDPKIGLGHFMRCLKIYNVLRENGKFVKIYIDKKNKFMENFNFKYDEIYTKKKFFINQNLDSKLFIKKVLLEYKNEKIVVLKDDYRLTFPWEKRVSNELKSKMAVFDDFDNSNHFTDLIINPKTKFYCQNKPIIKEICNKKTILLLGPKYSLINKIEKNKVNKKFTIVINFGGSKNTHLIKNILSIIALNNKNINFKIIISPYEKLNILKKKIASKFKNVQIIKNFFNLQQIYSKSHLFLGAAGTSVYETTAQKMPGIFFEISKNQKTSYKSLEKMGQYFFLTKVYLKKNNLIKLNKLILFIKKNYKILQKLIKNQSIKIDDKGVKRILKNIINIDKIIEKGKPKNYFESKKNQNKIYKITKCKFEDINEYIEARNRIENIKQSFRRKHINHLDHYIWWFKNDVSSFKLKKGEETIIFFYHHLVRLGKKKYFISGWFNASDSCTIQDIIYALNWQRNKINLKKRGISSWISFVKKDNILAQKYSEKLGWKRISDRDELYINLKNKFNMPESYVYIRK